MKATAVICEYFFLLVLIMFQLLQNLRAIRSSYTSLNRDMTERIPLVSQQQQDAALTLGMSLRIEVNSTNDFEIEGLYSTMNFISQKMFIFLQLAKNSSRIIIH